MARSVALLLTLVATVALGAATVLAASSQDPTSGSYRGRVLDELFRHRQALERAPQTRALLEESAPRTILDQGEIAVVDASRGALPPLNLIDLQGRGARLIPQGEGFVGTAGPSAFDEAARENGVPLLLGDDDSLRLTLPFDFPFFGTTYREVYVNSDGNLTFGESDSASSDRSLARAVSGPPRVAPLFVDLDPTRLAARVRAFSTADRVVLSWDDVPLFSPLATGARQTFQVELSRKGEIAFHYRLLTTSVAVVGVFPGRLRGEPEPVDFSSGWDQPTPGGSAEVFQLIPELDMPAASQAFFNNHDDAYDFLVFFNNFGLSAGQGAFAFELNVRNRILGIGDLLFTAPEFDFGAGFGSPRRLVSVMNMGPLGNYPGDPKAIIPAIGENTTLSVLSHEAGHRWLAYVDFIDPLSGERSSNLLGRQDAHWSFFFNSEASFLEGNRIVDAGPSVAPRFETVEAVSRFSPLDLYLMGLIPPEAVPNVFFVDRPSGAGNASRARQPQSGVRFNGDRRELSLDAIIAAEGPRLPDETVSEKEFHFAFVLVVNSPQGEIPAADSAKLDRIRLAFEDFFSQALGGRAKVSTRLVRMLDLSARPAAGVPLGGAGTATVSIAEPRAADLVVQLSSDSAAVATPPSVVVPAGALFAEFPLTGVAPGVAAVTARAGEPGFEESAARIQVRGVVPGELEVVVVEGDRQTGSPGSFLPRPIVVEVRDRNRLAFSGVEVEFAASAGAVDPARATTDEMGRVSVQWRLPEQDGEARLTARLAAAPSVAATAQASLGGGRPNFPVEGVVDAAGGQAGVVAGGLASIFGANLADGSAAASEFPLPRRLADAEVRVNGVPAPLLFVSPAQINFQVPFGLVGEAVEVVVEAGPERGEPRSIPLSPFQPGVFFDPAGGVVAALYVDGLAAWERPARPGEVLQIFATGLGPLIPPVETGEPAPTSPFLLSNTAAATTALVAGRRLTPSFSGAAPGFAGLYQVNAALPEDAASGTVQVFLEVEGRTSNGPLLTVE